LTQWRKPARLAKQQLRQRKVRRRVIDHVIIRKGLSSIWWPMCILIITVCYALVT